MKEPLVGILMATYNGEKYLVEQLDSIINQTYKNWILVIHDDGSIDSTIDIIKEYVNKYSDKIILVEDNIKCGGAKENFFHLINIAKSNFNFDYIMFSDQDDVWLPEKIEITLNKMIETENKYGKNKPILVHTDLKIVDENLNLISNSFWEYQKINPLNNSLNCLLLENTVTGCTMMINRILFDKIILDKNAIIHDWWIALICKITEGIIVPIEEQTILYRQHGRNDTGAKGASISRLLSRFVKSPVTFLQERLILSYKIRSQIKALANYYNNELLKSYIKDEKFHLKRKIFYLKKNMICGNIVKKIGKVLFY
jgi:glycosyltransferase involved in cell wall biosynthesis